MDATALGNALDHYHLEAPLGSGGMGVVYLAKDTKLSRRVAVKVLPANRLDEQARLRLRDEASTLSRLSHPNIASVFDFGSQPEIDYVVMEYVPGTTLDVLLQRGPLDSETVVRLGVQLARGLAAAHACGIVHRDIKPGNVRVTAEGAAEDPGLRRGDVRAAVAGVQDDRRVLRSDAGACGHDPVHGAGAPARERRPIRGPTSSAPARCCTRWRAGGRRSAIRSRCGSSRRS